MPLPLVVYQRVVFFCFDLGKSLQYLLLLREWSELVSADLQAVFKKQVCRA